MRIQTSSMGTSWPVATLGVQLAGFALALTISAQAQPSPAPPEPNPAQLSPMQASPVQAQPSPVQAQPSPVQTPPNPAPMSASVEPAFPGSNSESSALVSTNSVAADPPGANPDLEVRTIVDFGGLLPLYHHIQLGREGTEFNYVKRGGQDVIFPVGRLSVEVAARRHRITFLYQPLELNTEVVLARPLTVDGLTFSEQTPINLRYGFPFYRVSYTYDVAPSAAWRVALGGSFQLRDATITFTSADGSARRTRRDVGPVPALKASLRYDARSRWFGAFEVDGFYAPVRYFNGGDSDVEGAIIDANLRGGFRLSPRVDAFLNLRWLGGGAEGSSEPEDFSDGYNENWLHFLIVSLGVDFGLI
ncbi:MAG TPA: hypothetical protein VFQ61_02875 [Polyangiaceae bacterium]|nr:hypothetical protein [Polyangiaceae bacterium]